MSALDVLIAWKLKLHVLLLFFFSSCGWTLLRCSCTSHPKENPKRRTPMIFKGTHLLNKHNLLKWNTWRMLHIACSCFLCRMGFSAEQLAKWVAERTDVHVGSFYVIFLGDLFLKCMFYLISSKCESCSENSYYICYSSVIKVYCGNILSKTFFKRDISSLSGQFFNVQCRLILWIIKATEST